MHIDPPALMVYTDSHRILLAAVTAAALFLATSPGSAQVAESSPNLPAAFAGSWHYVGGAGEDRARHDAIEETIASMPAFMRALGRKRMHKSIQVTRVYRIEPLGANRIALYHGGGDPERVTLDGVAREREGYGKGTSMVTGELLERSFKVTWIRKDSTGWNQFTLSDDGSRLTVRRHIDSGWFGVPVEFDCSYARR
jgi:hypothetical protein